MLRLSNLIKELEDKAELIYQEKRSDLPRYILSGLVILYAYSLIIHSVTAGINNIWNDGHEKLFTLNPFINIASVFSPHGLGITLFVVIMY